MGGREKTKTRKHGGGGGPAGVHPPDGAAGAAVGGPWGRQRRTSSGLSLWPLRLCETAHGSRHAAQRARRDGLRKCANDSVLVLVLTMPSPLLRLPSGPKTCLAKTVIVVTHPSTPAHVALVTLWTGRRRETLRSARAYLWLSPKLAELAPHLSLLCLQRCQQQRSTILGHGCALLGGSSTRICRICGSKRCCQRGLHLVKRRQAATVHSFLRLHRNARQAYALH